MNLQQIQRQRNINSSLRDSIQSLRVIEATLCDAVQTATGSDPCEDYGLPPHRNLEAVIETPPCSGPGWAGGGGAGGGGEDVSDSERDSFNNISCVKETIELQAILANQIATTSLLTTLISETVDRMFEPMNTMDADKAAAHVPDNDGAERNNKRNKREGNGGVPNDFEAQLALEVRRKRLKK